MERHTHQNQMEENPPRVSRKEYHEAQQEVVVVRRSRYSIDDDDGGGRGGGGGGGGDLMECSGKYFKSCTAGVIADCVALCCCPCALVNFFALAFFKIPYTVGRRCLGRVKRKRKKKKKQQQQLEATDHHIIKRKCKKTSCPPPPPAASADDDGNNNFHVAGSLRKVGEDTTLEFVIHEGEMEEEDEETRLSARVEADRVWMEMYQIGHLGFGRVSFTGIQ